MRLYWVAKVIHRKFNRHIKVNLSSLVLTLEGSDYEQSGERNPSQQMEFLGMYEGTSKSFHTLFFKISLFMLQT